MTRVIKDQRPTSIDAYIKAFPDEVQESLNVVRSAIQAAAPEATEKISYQLPTFYLYGNLVHFGAWKNHIGFYPASSGVAVFDEELSGFERTKGTIRFPLVDPMPTDLITRIVRFRVTENIEKAALRRITKRTG